MKKYFAPRRFSPQHQVGMCVLGVVRRDATEDQVGLIPSNSQMVVGSLPDDHMLSALLTERVGCLRRLHRDAGFVHRPRRTGRNDVRILAHRHDLRRRRAADQQCGDRENSDFHSLTPVLPALRGRPFFDGVELSRDTTPHCGKQFSCRARGDV